MREIVKVRNRPRDISIQEFIIEIVNVTIIEAQISI